MTNANIL